MSKIYSFLQKRKMQENNHGFKMVFVAYLLSAFLLALGSDTFYNIDSKAADINTDIEEGTQEPLYVAALSNATTDDAAADDETTNDMMEPDQSYDLDEEEEDSSTSGDTVWLFGTEMNGETFDNLMQQTGIMPKIKKTPKKKVRTSSPEPTYSTAYGNISESDVNMLERIVQAEAGGEDTVGKILVANVVINRVKSGTFPKTIEGVILQHSGNKYQFSPAKSGKLWRVKISSSTKAAVEKALDGVDYSKGALYFISKSRLSSSKASWFDTRLDWLFKHGGHDFYKRR